MKLKLLSKTPDAKTKKSLSYGYTTFILYLDPRMKNICQWATPGCKASCLFTAGRGIMQPVMEARRRKTQWYLEDPIGFKAQLQDELNQIRKWSEKNCKKFCVRLNGTSDLDFLDLISCNPDIQFYDYTKSIVRLYESDDIPNYHVTFSRTEDKVQFNNLPYRPTGKKPAFNIAVVFHGSLPEYFIGRPVIDGDLSDLRFLDPSGVIVGLKAKGKAKKDNSGFVVRHELPMVNV